MEANLPSTKPSRPEQPGRFLLIVIGVVALLAAAFFGAISIDLAGAADCETAHQEAIDAGESSYRCTENRVAVVAASAFTALVSVALAGVAFRAARRRAGSWLLPALALTAAVAAIVTFAL